MLLSSDDPVPAPDPRPAPREAPSISARRLGQADDALLAGRVRDALTGFTSLVDLHDQAPVSVLDDSVLRARALAGLATCRLACGDLARAEAAVDRLVTLVPGSEPVRALAAHAFGEVSAAAGDPEAAVASFERSGSLLGAEESGLDPALVPWRAGAAMALLATGRLAEAIARAHDHLSRGQAARSPHAAAQALRVLATADLGARREGLLREARDAVAGVPAERLTAQLDADLACVLLLGGTRGQLHEARLLVAGVRRYAAREQLEPLRHRAERLAAAAGLEPMEPGAARLTHAERRVVDLAVDGLTNREVAGRLGVSVKAVEWHLSRVYRKLEIGSRRELASALAATRPATT